MVIWPLNITFSPIYRHLQSTALQDAAAAAAPAVCMMRGCRPDLMPPASLQKTDNKGGMGSTCNNKISPFLIKPCKGSHFTLGIILLNGLVLGLVMLKGEK